MTSIFDLPVEPQSINAGAGTYALSQILPVTQVRTGVALGDGVSGTTQFVFSDETAWWLPCKSYFRLRVQFVKYDGSNVAGAIPVTDGVAYADNFVPTLFTSIKAYAGGNIVDNVDVPHIIDTMLTYANSKKTALDSFMSLQRVGEPLMTRIVNTSQNDGYVEAVFRPPISLFGTKILPPGQQFRIDFTWAASCIAALESVLSTITLGKTSGLYNMLLQDFIFFKASVTPAMGIECPDNCVIDLCPSRADQAAIAGVNSFQVNLQPPGTTNRILLGYQDNNTTTAGAAAGTGGGNPATSFAYALSSGSSYFTSALSQLYINVPELQYTAPEPVYTLSGVQDWLRAYSDFCHITQGTDHGNEGSVPFGTFNTTAGAQITYIATDSFADMVTDSVLQLSDPNNPQRWAQLSKGLKAAKPAATLANQTARYGWAGRCPGPIFAFPIVRKDNRAISKITVSSKFGATVTNGMMYAVYTYSTALVCQNVAEPGAPKLYKYSFVEGL